MTDTSVTRRQVLASGAAAGLAGTLPDLSWLQGDPNRKVGFAILGLGGYATNQIMPAFARSQHSKITALISGTPDKLKQYGDQYGVPERSRHSYKELERIKDNPEIDVVYIITPPGTHREFTVRSAAVGKHVFSEKPMANTEAECREMIDACRKAGKLLMIGYRSHYEAHNLRAIEACRSGELGTLRSIASEHGFQASRTWRIDKELSGGGALWDIGIYGVNASRYLTGEDPVEVTAFENRLKGDDRFKEVDDVTHMVLRYPNGTLASISTGYSWRGANNYRVIGTKGTLVAEPATPYEGHRLVVNGKDPQVKPNDQFSAMLDHMSESVLSGAKTVRTPGEMGLVDIRILEASLRSAREGRSVKLS